MSRAANSDYRIHALFIKRHSPYAFDAARPVDATSVNALFEASRWTMSSYSAQPWRYIVGIRGDGTATWQQVHDSLAEGNQPWAKNAMVLGLVKTTFAPGPDIKPLTALAIGYQGKPEHIPEASAARDGKPRECLAQSEILL